MPMIPAICDKCSSIFPSGIFADNVKNLTISNVTAGPCPVCGGTGHTIEGTFNIFDNAIQILNAPERTYKELNSLATILKKRKEKGAPKEEIQENLETEFPFMAPLLSVLKNQHVQAWVTVILALIQLLLSNQQHDQNTENITYKQEIKYEQVINYIYETNINIVPSISEKNQPVQTNKIGRNEPCPCGSGLKYKKCHGR